ncbi:hypothetical protein QBC37DRAFT_195380 [Rhypophila decipiens]|uniref:Uncharacterized protein n=1 Tax=Rhypophila decipiens TaxID=261697 RepID=A0AAN6Y482_9PEZI|nr:hypothetical protein QBC37DRAFT_195380 [Rhypophila decipiens]
MEGTLCVPPEPRTIIGRAIWKPRYVVVGGPIREPQLQQPGIAGRLQPSRSSTPKGQFAPIPDTIFLSVYKSKEDYEPIQQHAIGTITDCQVQMVAHRKQGPVLPTLIINIVPDPATDKLRKRRSSRTAGLTATKDSGPTTLWFRNADEQFTLQDWARFIQQLIQPNVPDTGPLSPLTPASPTFINPFATIPRSRDASEGHRPNSRPALYSTGSHQTHSSRERPLTFSESTSLRSKRSDLSSQTSSLYPSHMTFQNYTAMHPTDLPSPATTIGEYQGEFIEGWTSAQGRSSTLSSPIRARDSIGSQIPPVHPTVDSSSPPGPRETILDRAFQLRCIPGSETETPGEEKLSSLARFDALMREADEKRKLQEAEEAKNRAARSPMASSQAELKSAWDIDDESDTDGENNLDEVDDDSDDPVGEMEPDLEDRFRRSPKTQSALEYVARRPSTTETSYQQPQRASSQRSPLSYQHDTQESSTAYTVPYQTRPQTGYSTARRPSLAQRMHSQPQLTHVMPPPTSPPPVPYLQPTSAMLTGRTASGKPADEILQGSEAFASAGPGNRRSGEKRLSISSTKRLSFSEFTKRLSSTSSLLLVQTNTSGGSSRGSNSDFDVATQQKQQSSEHYHHLNPRAAPPPPLSPLTQQHQQHQYQPGPHSPQFAPGDRDRMMDGGSGVGGVGGDKRCGWRGSVGVFGSAEGGFL